MPSRSPSIATRDLTGLLAAWGTGDPLALDQLMTVVNGELRRIARRHLRGERPGHTLQPTALVNEAFLRLIEIETITWQDRAHFFAMAARVMRRILVDSARAHRSHKRGSGAARITFDEARFAAPSRSNDVVALDEALEALARVDARKSQVVELRFFGGLSVKETAALLAVSTDTVTRDWNLAKSWLVREMKKETAFER